MASQEKCRIVAHQKLTPQHFLLTLSSLKIAASALPGQFVEVKCSDSFIPLLRRPISLHQIEPKKGRFSLLYEVVGQGTELLSQRQPGEELDILGPLGNGFSVDPQIKNHLLVGGGMGIAPLLALAEKLKQDKQGKVIMIAGARCKENLVRESELKKAVDKLLLATDDGSCGEKGLVSDVLSSFIAKELATGSSSAGIYACGPKPMLKAVAVVAQAAGIPAQLSLEERMACGIGACKGCAVKTTAGYKMACKDGPVFAAEEIIW